MSCRSKVEVVGVKKRSYNNYNCSCVLNQKKEKGDEKGGIDIALSW